MSSSAPLLFIVSSPSGAGKTTLTGRLREAIPELRFSVSHTTRAPRAGERDGREYHFVDAAGFRRLVESDGFLEWAEVHGNLYGTSRAEIDRAAGARGIIFDIDHQGARQIKSVEPSAVAVFILPPTLEVLLERLRGRASDDESTVQRRFRGAREEIGHYGEFDYVLVNDDVETATVQLVSIFRAEECRRARMASAAERLLRAGGPNPAGG
ncbi:MAG: guanylate kinase [Sorangiineae bacterium]|nr:guanylate kinase [Polyangiaceae bacterium]MEB2322287.1 guanylate kinase [Sorangiineae bacterium]